MACRTTIVISKFLQHLHRESYFQDFYNKDITWKAFVQKYDYYTVKSWLELHQEVSPQEMALISAFNNMDSFFGLSLVEAALDMCLFSGSLVKIDEGFDQITE